MTTADVLGQLKQQWRQSRLLRWGGLVIALLILFYSFSLAEDLNRKLEKQANSQQQRLGRLEQLLQEPEWPERSMAARQLRVQLESRLWQAPTRGVAQAELQSWLDRELKRAKINNVRLQIADTRESSLAPGLWEVGAQIQGGFEPATLLLLLRAIEGHKLLALVEQLEISRQRFDMQVTILVQPTEGQDD